MVNFGASKLRVRGGPGPLGPPPWIRTCNWKTIQPTSADMETHVGYKLVWFEKVHAFSGCIHAYSSVVELGWKIIK